MARKQEKPKRGRPTRHAGRPLAKSRTFRLLGALDEQLHAAAVRSKRSVAEEIEYRLSRSFYDDMINAGLLGGDVSADVLRLLRLVMAIEGLRGNWADDPISAANVRAAADTIIAVLANLPPAPTKGTAAAHWPAALTSVLLFAKSPDAWQAALPPELSSYAEYAEKTFATLAAARKELAK